MCERSNDLQSYLDNELDASQRAEFESHLATCPQCSAEMTKLRSLSALLRLYDPQLPVGMMSRVYDVIEDASGRMLIRLVTRLTAAAAVLLLAGSLWLVSQTRAEMTDTDNSVAEAQNVDLPSPWEHAAVALNSDPSPDVQFASLVLTDTSSGKARNKGMHRLKLLIVLAFAVAFAAGWIFGTATERAAQHANSAPPATQPHHPPPHPSPDGSWLKKELNLTADQSAKMKDISAPLSSARGKYMDQWQQIDRDRDEAVRNLLSTDQKAAVDSIYAEAEAEQVALENRRAKEYKDAVTKTNELLTPEQQTKYANILSHERPDRGRFPHPSSGPGGGPPPDHEHDHPRDGH